MKALIAEVRIALIVTAWLAALVSGLYPLSVWMMAQLFFPHQANGSLLIRKGMVIGSHLLAQPFQDAQYFHPRPSAAGQGYDAGNSGGSNMGPLSEKLLDTARNRAVTYRIENRLADDALLPADAVTASGSGLDPHISVTNALLQAPRVASARGIDAQMVLKGIKVNTEGPDGWVLGASRVNVLSLNLWLDNRW